jgi:SAM-dependent methyltransferase
MGLFRGTAWYYARFRPGYPPELIRRIAVPGRVLDLGTGTGQVAVPLAAYAAEVVAVDPEQEMLDEMEAPPNVRKVHGRAEDVLDTLGRFDLVTIGSALHWMEPGTLDRLPTDTVALLGEFTEESEARSTVQAVAEEILGPRPEMKHPTVVYEVALAQSPFSDVEVLSVPVERTWTVDQLVGYAYSTSFASLERVGDRREEFERELRARLRPTKERVDSYAVLGRRRDQ